MGTESFARTALVLMFGIVMPVSACLCILYSIAIHSHLTNLHLPPQKGTPTLMPQVNTVGSCLRIVDYLHLRLHNHWRIFIQFTFMVAKQQQTWLHD